MLARLLPGSSDATLTQYDVLLLAIPLTLGGGVAASVGLGLPVRTGVTAGSVIAAVLVAYALFGSPPSTGDGPGRRGPTGG